MPSAPNQYAIVLVPKGALSFRASAERYKYAEGSTNVSIVSVSRRAGQPHFGQVVFKNSGTLKSGEPPVSVIFTLSGKITGRSFSATGTTPSFSQYTIGIGVPQYRCREIPQSFSRKVTVALPNLCCSA